MSCEKARAEYVEALNEWILLEEKLKPIALSHIGTAGHPGEPIVVGSVDFEEWVRLEDQRRAAWERYDAAWRSYNDAVRAHDD